MVFDMKCKESCYLLTDKYTHTHFLTQWKTDCNHHHFNTTFSRWPPSPPSAPLHSSIEPGRKVITRCISHQGSLKYTAEFVALSEERWQDVSHHWPTGCPTKKKTAAEASDEWGNLWAGLDPSERNFLFGYPKVKMCKTHSAGTPDIKQPIRSYNESIPADSIQCVNASLPGGMQECNGGDGGHLKIVSFKCWGIHLTFHWIKNVCISVNKLTYACITVG
jgi:hypothetical protein